MTALYLDTSAFLAVLFEEPGGHEVSRLFQQADRLFASLLLEAEVRASAARRGLPTEKVDLELAKLTFFQPDRSITQELKLALADGPRLRGADLWHVACALYLAGDPSTLPFVTLDGIQARAASLMGFKVLPGMLPAPEAREPQAVYKAGKPKVLRAKKKG